MQQYHGKFTYPKLMQEFQCPICLEKLSSPARLPCDHAFCWSCITMFCLRVMQQPTAPPPGSPPLGSSTSSGTQGQIVPSRMSQMSQGWAPQQGNNSSDAKRFECPVCQKQHLLDLEALTVDKHLNDWVDPASSVSSQSTLTVAEPPSPPSPHSSEHENSTTAESSESNPTTPRESESSSAPLIPPQEPQWEGKLVIVLDLDGTLIASFPPRRAPYLPKHMRTHLVGKGSSLNPQGECSHLHALPVPCICVRTCANCTHVTALGQPMYMAMQAVLSVYSSTVPLLHFVMRGTRRRKGGGGKVWRMCQAA